MTPVISFAVLRRLNFDAARDVQSDFAGKRTRASGISRKTLRRRPGRRDFRFPGQRRAS